MTRNTITDGRNGLALLIGLLALGAVAVAVATGGVAAQDDVANETVEITNDTTDVLVEIDWDEDAPDDATADVEIVDADLEDAEGELDEYDYAGTLDGTEFSVDEDYDVHEDGVYHVELDTSNVTVEVDGTEFDAENGTVDLDTVSDETIEANDDVLSVELVATPTVADTIDADPGNVTETEFNVSDEDLETGDYSVYVFGTDEEIADVTIDTLGDSATIVGSLTGDVPTGYAVAGMLALLGGGWYARREGWL